MVVQVQRVLEAFHLHQASGNLHAIYDITEIIVTGIFQLLVRALENVIIKMLRKIQMMKTLNPNKVANKPSTPNLWASK